MRLITVISCNLLIFIASASVFSESDKSCETRVAELEKRIRVLERQLGISQAVTTPEPMPAVVKQPEVHKPQNSTYQSGIEAAAAKSVSGRAYPIAVMLVEKSFEEKGPGEESDRLGFLFEFRNCGKEHVTSFSGIIDIYNSNGDIVQSFPFDIATYVTVGDKTTWYVSIPFSSVNAVHRQLFTCGLSDLNAMLRLRQVMYYDTRVENFD